MSAPDPSRSGTDSNADHVLAQFADGSGNKRGKLAGWLMILLVIGLVVGPLLFHWIPQEAARWRMAAAEERRLDGDLPGAIQILDQALQQHPDHAALYLQRAECHLENDAYQQAIEDCTQAVRLDSNLPAAYFYRSQAYHHLGRHAEAVGDCQDLLRLSEELRGVNRAEALNGLAYGRALGKIDLEEGLANAEEAIRLAGDQAELLDTRGFLHFQLGNLEPALADLDKAVALGEVKLASHSKAEQLPDARYNQIRREQLEQAVAVMRYHRGLVHEAMGNPERAAADYQRVRDLGREPAADLF